MSATDTKANLFKIMDKARKLMALAERAGTPEEAANAANKLSDMLHKYDLSISEVLASTPEDFETQEYTLLSADPALKGWASSLYYAIAKSHQCEAIMLGIKQYQKGVKSDPYRMACIGRKHHIEIVNYLNGYLFHVVKNLAEVGVDATGKKGMERIRWKTAFCYGAVSEIRNRLEAEKIKRQQECANSNALVVSEERAVTEAKNKKFPKLTQIKREIKDVDARNQGKIAGRSINLRPGLKSGKTQPLIC